MRERERERERSRIPDTIFWAEKHLCLPIPTPHHNLVQFWVPIATDHTLEKRRVKNHTPSVTRASPGNQKRLCTILLPSIPKEDAIAQQLHILEESLHKMLPVNLAACN